MFDQRLPIVDSDDGVWGDILRQYLMKEHVNDDTNNPLNGGHKTITVAAGTTSANTAPITLTSGSLMTSPEVGAIEFLTDDLYFTRTSGTTRDTFVFAGRTQTLTNKTLTSPTISNSIQISSNTAGGDQVVIDNTNTTGRAELVFQEGAATKGAFQYRGTTNSQIPNTFRFLTQSGTNADLILGTNGSSSMFIAGGQNGLTAGNIGIGTTTPSVKLHVSGEIRATTAGTDSASAVTVGGAQTLTNKTLTDPRVTLALKDANGNTAFQVPATASAVNFVNIANAATGGTPALAATGSDTDVGLYLRPKGAGSVSIRDGNNAAIGFWSGVASAVNRFTFTNSATGSGPIIATGGTDADIDLLLTAKGTGVVKADGVEVATISGTQTLTDKTLTAPRINEILDTSGNRSISIWNNASAVNYFILSNNVAGQPPYFAVDGDDTNINIGFTTKGTGILTLWSPGGVPGILADGPGGSKDFNLQTTGTGVVQANGVEVATVSGAQTLTDKTLGATTFTGAQSLPLSSKTANYTLTSSDHTVLFDATSAAVTATLPAASGATGRVYVIKKIDSTANTVTVDADSSETIDGSTTHDLSTQWESVTIQSTGSSWVIL